MILRRISIVVALLWPGQASLASAGQPWKPGISIQAADRIGNKIHQLDPQTLRQFAKSYEQGLSFLAQGRYRDARTQIARATQLNPDHVEARLTHVRILLTLGYLSWDRPLIKLAEKDIQHAIRIAPSDQRLRLVAYLLEGLLERMNSTRKYKKTKKK
jgi:tetratricopeptide (TPR) repeat protein